MREIMPISYKIFLNEGKVDKNFIEDYLDLSIEILNNNCIEEYKDELKDIVRSYNIVSKKLSFHVNDDIEKAYQYGMVRSLSMFLLKMDNERIELCEVKQLRKKSKYLINAMLFLEEEGYATGKEIIEALGMKNKSDLSNFMSRVKEYNLFTVRKIGRYNYYSLSKKGMNYIKKLEMMEPNQLTFNGEKNYYLEFVLNLVECLGDEITEQYPNIDHIIRKANMKTPNSIAFDSKVLRLKLQSVLDARENYLEKKKRIDLSSTFFSDRDGYFWHNNSGLNETKLNTLTYTKYGWDSIIDEKGKLYEQTV